MKTFGQEVKTNVNFSSDKIIKLRIDLIEEELEELKDYDVITENERGTSQEFVMHGANLAGQVNILKNAKKETPRGDREIIKKKINHSSLYVSWIKEPDYSKDIRECWSEYKDHGWACGSSAGFIACKEEKPKEG